MTPKPAPVALTPTAPAIAERACRSLRYGSPPRRIFPRTARRCSAPYLPPPVACACILRRAATKAAPKNTTGAPGSARHRRSELLHP